jgi:hypothetical protein
MFQRCIIILSVILHVSLCDAISQNTGITSGVFLKLGMGARVTAIGDTFCAIADDINSICYNPAGLSQIIQDEFACVYHRWFEGIHRGFLSYVSPCHMRSVVAGTVYYLNSGDILETTYDEPAGTGGKFKIENIAYTFSYAYMYKRNKVDIGIGINVKYIQEKLCDIRNRGFSIDTGILCRINNTWGLGFCIQNISTKTTRNFPLPLNFKAGISYLSRRIITGIDINKPVDNNISIHTGLEYIITELCRLRIGYRYYLTDNKLDMYTKDKLYGITLGIGIKFHNNYYLNYAFLPYGDLGVTHHVSLLIRFPPKWVSHIRAVKVIDKEAVVFSGPGVEYEVIGKVYKDEILEVLDSSTKWYYHVYLSDGSLGWVSYISVEPCDVD